MTDSSLKNARRTDPYKNFKFRVTLDGRTVMGVSKINLPTGRIAPSRDKNKAFITPGHPGHEAITLDRGITLDPGFQKWADIVRASGGVPAAGLANNKKDLAIEAMNEKGQISYRYKVFRCWVSEYTALPDLDADANAVAIEHIKIENEGWERDLQTEEPDEKP